MNAKRYELLPYVGPPFVLPLWATISRVSFQDAARVWTGLLLVAGLGLVGGTAKLLRRKHRWDTFSLVLLAIAFGPLTSNFALGQVAVVAFAAVIWTLLLVQSRGWWSSAATTLTAAVQPNVALLLLAAPRGRRATIVVSGGLVLFLTLSLKVSGGMSDFLKYFSILHHHLDAERYAVIQITPTAIAFGFGLPQNVSFGAGSVLAIGAIASATYFLLSRSYDFTVKLALLCSLLPFAVPFFHEHDLVVVFFPAALCMFAARGPLRAVSFLGILLVAVDWLGIAQRPSGTLQSLLLASSALCALLISTLRLAPLRHAQGDRVAQGDRAAQGDRVAQGDTGQSAENIVMLTLSKQQLLPLIVMPLIVVCGLTASGHPAPVWPDAMRALPADLHSLSASEAWHAELRRTGLLAPDTFWAALRSLSLLGCGVLTIVCAKLTRAMSDL